VFGRTRKNKRSEQNCTNSFVSSLFSSLRLLMAGWFSRQTHKKSFDGNSSSPRAPNNMPLPFRNHHSTSTSGQQHCYQHTITQTIRLLNFKIFLFRRNYPRIFLATLSSVLLLFILMPLNNLNNRSKPTNYFLKKELNQNALISWWKNHPNAARGLSCEENSDLSYDEKKNYDMDAIFTARTPVASSAQKRQLAFVIPFVDFQMNKLKVVLRKHWMKTPPCKNDSEQADADLIFVTPMELSAENKKQIQESFAEVSLCAKRVS